MKRYIGLMKSTDQFYPGLARKIEMGHRKNYVKMIDEGPQNVAVTLLSCLRKIPII
jgi:hypothetical protein